MGEGQGHMVMARHMVSLSWHGQAMKAMKNGQPQACFMLKMSLLGRFTTTEASCHAEPRQHRHAMSMGPVPSINRHQDERDHTACRVWGLLVPFRPIKSTGWGKVQSRVTHLQ